MPVQYCPRPCMTGPAGGGGRCLKWAAATQSWDPSESDCLVVSVRLLPVSADGSKGSGSDSEWDAVVSCACRSPGLFQVRPPVDGTCAPHAHTHAHKVLLHPLCVVESAFEAAARGFAASTCR